jgi:hypothetical protein
LEVSNSGRQKEKIRQEKEIVCPPDRVDGLRRAGRLSTLISFLPASNPPHAQAGV